MIIRPPTSALRLRALAAATGLVLASTLLVPGAALAANGPPHPGTDTVITNEDTPAAGNVLANDTNGGQGPLDRDQLHGAEPGHRHPHDRRRRQLRVHAGRELERVDVDLVQRREQQAHPPRHDQHHRARGQRRARPRTTTRSRPPRTRPATSRRACSPTTPTPMATRSRSPSATNATGGTVGLAGRRRHVHPDRRRVRRGRRLVRLHRRRRPWRLRPGPRHGQRDLRRRRPGRDRRRRLGPRGRRRRHLAADLASQRHRPRGRRPHRHRRERRHRRHGRPGRGRAVTFTPTARPVRPRRRPASTTPSTTATAAPTRATSASTSPASTTPRWRTTTRVTVEQDSTANDVTSRRSSGNDTDTEGDSLTVSQRRRTPRAARSRAAGVVTFTPAADGAARARAASTTRRRRQRRHRHGHVTVDVDCTLNVAPVANDDTRPGHRGHGRRHRRRRPHRQRHRRQRRRPHRHGRLEPAGGTVGVPAGTVTFTPDHGSVRRRAALRLHRRRRQRRHRHRARHHRPRLRDDTPSRTTTPSPLDQDSSTTT